MSIEAHHCNQPNCKGFILFENADFDFKDIATNEKYGCYAFDNPTCSECGKDFLVVPHYMVIDIKDNATGDFEQVESACITAYEKRERNLRGVNVDEFR